MLADQLPDSFAVAATLHLAGSEWQVEQAEPVTRAEFQRTGTLRLTLRAIQHMQPDEILYSMPTICDELPPVQPGHLPRQRAFTLHEDLWCWMPFACAIPPGLSSAASRCAPSPGWWHTDTHKKTTSWC